MPMTMASIGFTSETITRSLTILSVTGKLGTQAGRVKAKKCAALYLAIFQPFV